MNLSSPTNDEQSILIDSDRIWSKKVKMNQRDESNLSHSSSRGHQRTRSLTSYSMESKSSSDDRSISSGSLIKLNDIYPSNEHEELEGIPLAFLGAEKFLGPRMNWKKLRYPLNSNQIEMIIDLFFHRPSFVREIPKVTKFDVYRPLTRSIRGELFFDHPNHRAAVHRCDRRATAGSLSLPFTLKDLTTIHRREFHLIALNGSSEQRFIDLLDSLSPIYEYQSQSIDWKVFLERNRPDGARD